MANIKIRNCFFLKKTKKKKKKTEEEKVSSKTKKKREVYSTWTVERSLVANCCTPIMKFIGEDVISLF
ncbi:hypothetical protein P8452_15725 [Trifolium repens]|nr:hypothetical protein P8452_15725 [Trifolium repens]